MSPRSSVSCPACVLTQGAIPLMKCPMSSKQVQPNAAFSEVNAGAPFFREELPLTVREAATYLGVSVQPVYLRVERKRMPHRRVMGVNLRFLRAAREPFRATFKQDVGDGKT